MTARWRQRERQSMVELPSRRTAPSAIEPLQQTARRHLFYCAPFSPRPPCLTRTAGRSSPPESPGKHRFLTFHGTSDRLTARQRRGDRVVECAGLENRLVRKGHGSSNLPLSVLYATSIANLSNAGGLVRATKADLAIVPPALGSAAPGQPGARLRG